MPLFVGDKLGPFEILAPIGADLRVFDGLPVEPCPAPDAGTLPTELVS